MGDIKTKETTWSWMDECYKADPSLKYPTPTYIFDNGNRVFYTETAAKKKQKKGRK